MKKLKLQLKRLLIFIDGQINFSYKKNNQLVNLSIPYKPASFGDCGIGCAAMILSAFGRGSNVKTLRNTYKTSINYNPDIGWKHKSLVKILDINHIKATSHQYRSTNFIKANLLRQKPIIASIKIPNPQNLNPTKLYQPKDKSKPNEGHLVVIKGITKQDEFILHDPRNIGKYSQSLKVPLKTFQQIFYGNCITVEAIKFPRH